MLHSKQPVVMTLDAGGTNFVFSAMQDNEEIISPIRLPSFGNDLSRCLAQMVAGFDQVKAALSDSPEAISFAFPGPADYPAGIIGDLGNLPGFRGGVALGPMLEDRFGIPVFINNDGDLFALGEARAGLLPEVNRMLEAAGSPKRFRNLFGVTLGTGFGGGFVHNGNLIYGDNAAGGEIWVTRNKLHPASFAEEGASIRAVRRVYGQAAGMGFDATPEPRVIYEIGTGQAEGHRAAAEEAFSQLGETVGDALANAMTLLDGLVVIGGGLAGAQSLFMSSLVQEMNTPLHTLDGSAVERMEIRAYNLESEVDRSAFLTGEARSITVPGTSQQIAYDPMKRIGVGVSRLGTSQAVAVGAYGFAINQLGV